MKTLLGKKGFLLALAGFNAGGTLGVLTWDPTGFAPSAPMLLFLGGLEITLVLLGYRLPRSFLHSKIELPDKRPLVFGIVSTVFLLGFFAIFVLGPIIIPWPAVDVALFPAIGLLTGRYFLRHIGTRDNERQKSPWLLVLSLAVFP